VLQAAGHEVFVAAPSEVDGFAGYDAAVIGSAIYVGRWLDAAREILERHKVELRAKPVWLFASGPIGDPPRPAGNASSGAPADQRRQALEREFTIGHLTFTRHELLRHRMGGAEMRLETREVADRAVGQHPHPARIVQHRAEVPTRSLENDANRVRILLR